MSNSHKLLAEALASFPVTFSSCYAGVTENCTAEEAINQMLAQMLIGKALFSPGILAADGEYRGHQLTMREPAPAGERGRIVLEIIIAPKEDNANGALECAAVAHGIIALAANAAAIVTQMKAREAEAAKKDLAGAEAGPAEPSKSTDTRSGEPDAAAPTDQSSFN